MKVNGKISSLFKNAGYNIAAAFLLIIQGLTMILLGLCRVWKCFRNSVQHLHYPPPHGGMYGNMAKRLKNKSTTSPKQ